MNIGDIYEKNEVYFIVVELTHGQVTKSMPLSRWILKNYIGSTQDALNVFEEMIKKCKGY